MSAELYPTEVFCTDGGSQRCQIQRTCRLLGGTNHGLSALSSRGKVRCPNLSEGGPAMQLSLHVDETCHIMPLPCQLHRPTTCRKLVSRAYLQLEGPRHSGSFVRLPYRQVLTRMSGTTHDMTRESRRIRSSMVLINAEPNLGVEPCGTCCTTRLAAMLAPMAYECVVTWTGGFLPFFLAMATMCVSNLYLVAGSASEGQPCNI